jgi:hypothetical protein
MALCDPSILGSPRIFTAVDMKASDNTTLLFQFRNEHASLATSVLSKLALVMRAKHGPAADAWFTTAYLKEIDRKFKYDEDTKKWTGEENRYQYAVLHATDYVELVESPEDIIASSPCVIANLSMLSSHLGGSHRQRTILKSSDSAVTTGASSANEYDIATQHSGLSLAASSDGGTVASGSGSLGSFSLAAPSTKDDHSVAFSLASQDASASAISESQFSLAEASQDLEMADNQEASPPSSGTKISFADHDFPHDADENAHNSFSGRKDDRWGRQHQRQPDLDASKNS